MADDRAEPIHIVLPESLPPAAKPAASIVIAALREAGLDPWKAATVPLLPAMAREWIEGKWTRQQFIESCRKLAIMNPSLVSPSPGGGRRVE